MVWYETYGFEKNPFSIEPTDFIIGEQEQQKKLLDYVYSGDFCLLTGETGTGKTSLVKKLINKELKSFKCVFVDCDSLAGEGNIEINLFEKRFLKKSFFDFLIRKEIIIFLDEMQSAPIDFLKQVKSSKQANKIKSVVGIQIENKVEYGSFKDRIGNKVIEMQLLNEVELRQLIKYRLNDNPKLFDDEAIQKIINIVGKIPRRVLDGCKEICIYYQSEKDAESRITKEEITRWGEERKVKQIKPELEKEEIKVVVEKKEEGKTEIEENRERFKIKFKGTKGDVLTLLAVKDSTLKVIYDKLGKSPQNITKVLDRLMKKDGIVEIKKDVKPKVYGLTDEYRKKIVID